MKRKSGLAHCCHHDRHWEFCYDFDERVLYIKSSKPESEQGLRLRLFQIIPDDLLPGKDSSEWADYDKAWADYYKAWADYDKARADYYKAWADYYKARADYDKARADYDKARADYLAKYQTEIDVLHDQLFPDCPFDGITIFTRKNDKGEWY